MFSKISSPNVLAAASSLKGESSYSHHASYELGVAVIDRFTYFNLEVLEKVESGSQSSLKDLFDTAGWSSSLYGDRVSSTLETLPKKSVIRVYTYA